MQRTIWLASVSTLSSLVTLAGCSSSTTAPATEAGAAPLNHLIGDDCPNGSGDCAMGLQCAGEDPGGGQCFKPCTPSMDAECGDVTKYVCSNEGHCYLRCTSLADCKRSAQGYVCKDDMPARPPVKFCDTP